MQASAWPERKQSSKGRKEVVGVAQIHIERLRVGFDGRQGPLIGPCDAKCRRKLGQEIATKGVFGLRPSLEMDGTSGAPHPKQGKGRHRSIARKKNLVRSLHLPPRKMHPIVIQTSRPTAGRGDGSRQGEMEGTPRLSFKANLLVC